MKKLFLFVILLSAALITLTYCAQAEKNSYADGVYEGEYSFVKVRVRVKGGEISDIEILSHGGGGKKYENMIEPLKSDIIRTQSTEVDSITGATVSSKNLKKAVENALKQK
ncbi:MAG: FMN-binding protein [bacterium]|nr:FMN-binding protein [bacterium]